MQALFLISKLDLVIHTKYETNTSNLSLIRQYKKKGKPKLGVQISQTALCFQDNYRIIINDHTLFQLS